MQEARKETRRRSAVVSKDDVKLIKQMICQYPELIERCEAFERKRKSLLARLGIKPEMFSGGGYPPIKIFRQDIRPLRDRKAILDYLDGKEKVFLLELGVSQIEDDETRELAERMFLEGLTRKEAEEEYGYSQTTITRRQWEAMRAIADEIDSYTTWKVENLYL